jgi:hypothetical protein
MSKNKNWKKVKIQDAMNNTSFFLGTLLFNPWAVIAMWLHVGAF